LKYFFNIFLYLNICIGFLCNLNAQKLQLSIVGENAVSESLLDSINLPSSFNNYMSLKQELDSLGVRLARFGFIENSFKKLLKKNDSSYVATFYFGPQFKSIKIYYSQMDFSKKELINISTEIKDTYFVIPFITIERSLQKLNSIKSNEGDPFSRLKLNEIKKQDNFTLSAQLNLISGKKRTIDNIIVKGYEKFPMSFLKYYSGLRKKSVFNKEKVRKQSEALNSLGFVSNIKAPEVLFEKDSTSIYLYLKTEKDKLFDGILGFATDEETQKLTFNGYLNLELNNNLNFGEQFTLNYKADGNDQQNFRVKVAMPYIFKTPVGLELELKIFKRDSTFVTTEQDARLTYQINPSTNSYLGFKGYESSNLLDEPLLDSTVKDYNSNNIIAGFSFIKLQSNDLFPIKTSLFINSEIGSRTQERVKEAQFRFTGVLNYIFNLNFKNSIYLQNTSAFLTSDTFLTNELYRFGGINTIRGFNENSIDASFYSVVNTEYRYQFNNNIYIHSIIDFAYFENQVLSIKEKLYSFGLGLGLQTNAGIIKFNIANGITDNQDFNFSNTKIHISISSRF
jgi:outer membrane protein assembly factor BamA